MCSSLLVAKICFSFDYDAPELCMGESRIFPGCRDKYSSYDAASVARVVRSFYYNENAIILRASLFIR